MTIAQMMDVHVFPEEGVHEILCVTDEHYEKNIRIESDKYEFLRDDIINSEILGWQTKETGEGTIILVSIKYIKKG